MRKPIIPILLVLLFSYPILQAQSGDSTTIGVVLMGGGALGLAHVGVLDFMEENEIPVDRIGGTSMGGIIAGLYAMGYSSDALINFTKQQDWDFLLSNRSPWKHIPLDVIKTRYRYILSLQKGNDGKLGFDNALINGINIYQKMEELAFPIEVHQNYEELPLPFFCIGVDLISGEEVVLDKGYMPDALLSTMAIPGVFNPVKHEEKLLVDGGVLNNFPVKEMRDRGADIVVGVRLVTVDSTQKTYNGPIDVLSRTYDIITQQARSDFEGDCDICIDVPLQGYSMADFNEGEALILRGRQAAEAVKEELLQLKKIKPYEPVPERKLPEWSEKDSINVWEIHVMGNKNISKAQIRSILKIEPGSRIAFSEFQDGINRLHASNHFNQLFYNFLFDEQGTIIILNVEERSSFSLNAGIRYDSDFGMGLLINPEVKNWGGFGNLLEMEMRINRNPYIKIDYLGNTSKVVSPLFALSVSSDRYFEFSSDDDFDETQYNQLQARVGLQFYPHIKTAFGFGLEWQYYGFTDKIQRTVLDNLRSHLFNYYLQWENNALNSAYYPSRGRKIRAHYKLLTDDFANFGENAGISWLSADFEQYFPLSNKLVLGFSAQAGYSSRPSDRQYLFYRGGMDRHMRLNSVIQAGQQLMQHNGLNVLAAQSTLRLNPFKDQYYWVGYSLSSLSPEIEDIFEQTWGQGVIIGAGLNSIFGPLEIWLSSSTSKIDLELFVKAGFRF